MTTLGVCLGIGLLLYFKYLNFFITSFSDLFSAIGLHTNWSTFNIIMPVGISFFTFKLISYVLEIYRQRMEPVTDIVAFAAYAAFFPTMMAGPIDRPKCLCSQLQTKHTFDYSLAVDGCRQILWGMFKKMVIADNVAVVVDRAWNNIPEMSGINLVIAVFLYTIQLYADFSGYSDMAIGVGKLLGFRITKNFNYPFFARNIAEFWRNWHISLTSWLTDYVFMPLNIKFRNWGKWGTICAIIINFVLVGFWHGANWTFGVFGLYHGLLYIPLILSGAFAKKNKLTVTKWGLPSPKDFAGMLVTFVLVTFGNIIFRAGSIGQAWEFMRHIVLNFLPISFASIMAIEGKKAVLGSIALLAFEWHGRKEEYAIESIGSQWKKPYRWGTYIGIVYLILTFIQTEGTPFIYFQF
ncbi:MBOAT family O-acyltransferase [Treponema endosymbiont of Eucomonympha sp.]|uniref:MBOAT family O-acyltransferase n=1 Tax=Treponema endosymbiont of Eucomonympha sp. TaxID=1580831 RepID=UPI000B02E157|nr:MBOAT family protein [Treponema endosymbiont of Eucomonympha sp.]